MDFLDKTGHIFSLKSYESYPIGYEYEETPYIFWFNTEKSYKLSIDNWYFQSIRLVIPVELNDTINVKLSLNSDKFYLLGSKDVQDELLSDKFNDINDRITLYSKNFKKELNYKTTISLEDGNLVLSENRENINLLGCLVERTSYKTYLKQYFTYNDGVNVYRDTPIYRDGKFYGIIKIGPIYKEIELDDERITKEVILGNEELTEDGEVKTGYYREGSEDGELKSFSTSILTRATYYLILPFYCLVKSSDIGTWETNILVQYGFDDSVEDEFCPITVGAEFVDENEFLIINGQNMGVKLPKEILKAVYSGEVYSSVPDEALYAKKLKEYLLNYMNIKGEVGNYKSAINSLKWFEWGDLLTISKLYKRDVDLQNQYLRDYFDITNDNIYSYQLFLNTTLISLSFKLNQETFDSEGNLIREYQDFKKFFAGEGKPILEDKLSKLKERRYDEEDIPFYRGYYDYTLSELGLKLCMLKYYYEKYFLPIHIKVHSATLSHQVWMNDIKFFARTNNYITEVPVYNGYNNSTYNSENSNSDSENIKVNFNYPNAVNNDVIFINHLLDTLDPVKDKAQLDLNYHNYLSKYPNTTEEDYFNDIDNYIDFYYFDDNYNCFSNNKLLASNTDYKSNLEYLPINISLVDGEVNIDNNIDGIISINSNEIVINNSSKKRIKYILSGELDNYYLSVYSNVEPYIVLNGVTLSNTSNTLININTTQTAYIELLGENNLGSSDSYIKKGISSIGDLVFFNTGSLTIYSNDSNCIDSDTNVRIYNGNFNLYYTSSTAGNSKNCINSKGNIIIYNGTIYCSAKGYCTSLKLKASSCIKADKSFIIYDGNLTLIASNDGDKCISIEENLISFGGRITADTFGDIIYNLPRDDKKSPKPIKIEGNLYIAGEDSYIKASCYNSEAIECSGTFIIEAGKLICKGNDDGLNIRGDIFSYGGEIYSYADGGDGIDCNGNIYALGGVIVGLQETTQEGNYGIDVEFEDIDENGRPYLENEKRFVYLGDDSKEHYGTIFDFRSIAHLPNLQGDNPWGSMNDKYKYATEETTILNKENDDDFDNYLTKEVYYLFKNDNISFVFKPRSKNTAINLNFDNYRYVYSSSYDSDIRVIYPQSALNNEDLVEKVFDDSADFYVVKDLPEFINSISQSDTPTWSSEELNYKERIIDSTTYDSMYEEYSNLDNLDKLNYITPEEEIENNSFEVSYVDDTGLFIPIDIVCPDGQYLDVQLELYKEGTVIHKSNFKFIQSQYKKYKGLVIYPKAINKDFDINYWENKEFSLKLLINGNYFQYDFIAKTPEINIGMGKLNYKYNDEFKQLKSISSDKVEFNSYMYTHKSVGTRQTMSVVTVNNLDWEDKMKEFSSLEIDSLYKRLENYVSTYYSSKINTINKYLNYCYLIDIFDSNGEYISVSREENTEYSNIWEYINKINGINDNKAIIQNVSLYNDFFDQDCNIKDNIIENISKNLTTKEVKENYDFYLMHDFDKWYLICISKDTTENIKNPLIINSTFKSDNYNFKFLKVDKKLLINRFEFIEEEGYNHFNEEDLVAFYLRCNDKLKFKITSGTKWKINQISIKNPISLTVDSNSELALVSLNKENNKLNRGYYNISVSYSIDDYYQNIKTAIGKFRVD